MKAGTCRSVFCLSVCVSEENVFVVHSYMVLEAQMSNNTYVFESVSDSVIERQQLTHTEDGIFEKRV